MGLCGAYSFFPTKNLGAFGDGGLMVTHDDALAERLRKIRVHGGRQMYHHEFVGTNSRLDALQAAVLRAKLPHLDEWTRLRRENAARYDILLADIPGVEVPHRDPGSDHVFNQYTIRTTRRDELREHLSAHGIGAGIYYPVPLHLQAWFAELGGRPGDLPRAEEACGEVLSLPVFPLLGEDRAMRVADEIRRFHGA
jgi:dTDP-4-amino-4,6-dideoxygalactose transaminase